MLLIVFLKIALFIENKKKSLHLRTKTIESEMHARSSNLFWGII